MFDMTKVKSQGGAAGLVVEDATINFDTTDFFNMVNEADYSITNTINSYRNLFNETLTESEGVLNESTDLIMEQANEHVGNRVVKALQAIWQWIVNKVKEISLKAQALTTSNKKVADKIKTVVSNNAAKVKNLKGEMYEYNLDFVKVNAITDFNTVLKGSIDGKSYDLTSDYTPANKEQLDAAVAVVNGLNADAIKNAIVAKATNVHSDSFSKSMEAVAKGLRGGSARKTVAFNMKYFDYVVSVWNDTKGMIDVNNKFAGNVSKLVAEAKAKLGAAKGEDKAFNAGLVAYYNAKRKVLSTALTAVMALNFSKLFAIIERSREAKRFCIQAYNLAKKDSAPGENLSESSVEPYAPYLDVDDEFADFDDESVVVETTTDKSDESGADDTTTIKEGAEEGSKNSVVW